METTPTTNKSSWSEIKNNWEKYRAKVKEKWNKLTDEDLSTSKGDHDEISESLQSAYGTSREQIEKDMNEFASGLGSAKQTSQPVQASSGQSTSSSQSTKQ